MALFISPMFLWLPVWFTTSSLFAASRLTTLVRLSSTPLASPCGSWLPGVLFSVVTALGLSTPFVSRFPLHLLCLLIHPLRLLPSPPPPPLRGTVALAILAALLCPSSVAVPLCLAPALLMSICVMHASWAVMLDFLSLPPPPMRLTSLILSIATCGHLLFLVCLATSTTWWWLMTSPITLGLFPCVPSPIHSPLFATSLHGCPPSSASPSRPCSVTTGVSLITPPLAPSSSPVVSSCACLALTPPLRTARLSA
jgi:hypothetical protein